MDIKKIHFLSDQEAAALIKSIKNIRHRVLVLLMIDCGLRVSECITLKYSAFDFKAKILYVKSLKKNGSEKIRGIPFSDRLYRELGNYFYDKKTTRIKSNDDYVFPSKNKSGHITRFAVNKMLHRVNKRLSFANLHPQSLRHTFATKHVTGGTPIHNIKHMLGHNHLNTTLKYTDIPAEVLRKNIENLTNPKSWLKKLLALVMRFINKPARAININFNPGSQITIGRNDSIQRLHQLASNKINTVIIGSIGVGKSHLLQVFEESVLGDPNVKILKLDDTGELKKSLAQMLVYILQTDQEGVFAFLFPAYNYNEAVAKVSRDNTLHIAKEIIRLTDKKRYTLMIDNVDRIAPKSVKVLEIFKDHFTIITTAREVPVNRSSFLWNFEIMRLQPLAREFALQLIHTLSEGIQVEDFQLYKNHIYEQTNGNPRAIMEIIERYRKEPVITNNVIRHIRHTGALPEYDCTFIILLFLACVACLRYLNHEIENASFRVLGGIALVFLFISRYFFKYSRKTHI